MKKIIFTIMPALLAAATLSSCHEDLNMADYERPSLEGAAPSVKKSEVKPFGVAAEVTVTAEVPEGTTFQEAGAIYGLKENLELADTAVARATQTAADAAGDYKVAINGLRPDTTYYVRPYVFTSAGIAYGETVAVKTDNSYAQQPFYSEDFTQDMSQNAAFSAAQLSNDGTALPFTNCSMAAVGLRMYGWASSIMDVNKLFGQGKGSIVSKSVDNVLNYAIDLTGRSFVSVDITALNIGVLFGPDYLGVPGNFDVYVSTTPVQKAEDLDNAVQLGTFTFPTAEDAQGTDINTHSFEIPLQFSGKTYIVIRNKSYDDGENGNYGTAILGLDFSSLEKSK